MAEYVKTFLSSIDSSLPFHFSNPNDSADVNQLIDSWLTD